MVTALWQVSHGLLSVDEFVSRYGFPGPEEGEISAISWREDANLASAIFRNYADRGVEDGAGAAAQDAR